MVQLHAVVVPPEHALREALDAVPALLAAAAPAAPAADESGRGLLAKLRRRPSAEPEPAVSFVPAAAESVFVKMSKFGNVAGDVAANLTASLEAAAGTWRAPVLRVARLVVADAAPFEVSVELEGDLDALRDVYRQVIEVAELHRFYLDRRSFRGAAMIGSLVAADGGELPESVAGAEVAVAGEWWTASHLTLLRTSFSGGAGFAEVARLEMDDAAGEAEVRQLA